MVLHWEYICIIYKTNIHVKPQFAFCLSPFQVLKVIMSLLGVAINAGII